MKNIFLSLLFIQICWFSSLTAMGSGSPRPETDDQNNPGRCHADFTTQSISEFVLSFEDLSTSYSHIISREWNFDDVLSGQKNRSHQKNPVHEFSGPGTFNVCLKITSESNCTDSVYKTIVIGEANFNVQLHGHVYNSVTGTPVAGQPVIVNADIIHYSAIKMTNVEGFYQDTIPDAPAGSPIIVSVFDCDNTLHSQTVYSSDTPLEVNFTICALAPCKAVFSSRLDSANSVQNTFVFSDSSQGHPDRWFWNFGDGNWSHDQNPVHSYQNPGHYSVCLTIQKRDLSGGIICSDSSCSQIVNPVYYNLGGLVFAGLYPINNPASTGDTGVAYLYRLKGNKVSPLDSIRFTYLGYYAFLHLFEGTYIVKAGLTEGSAHYNSFMPEYSGNQMKWQSATGIVISGSNSFANDIHFIQVSETPGIGSVGGYVSHKEKGLLIGDAEVILYDEFMTPVSYTFTDEEGRFNFAGIGYGKYFLYPEITGKFAALQEVNIDEGSPAVEGIVLEVSDLDFTGIGPSDGGDYNDAVRLFPNPFTDEIHVQITSEGARRIVLDISTITGKNIYNATFERSENTSILNIPLTDIPKGLYFLTLRSEDGKLLTTRKVIKN